MRYLSFTLALLLALFPIEVLAESAQVMLVSPSSNEELSGANIEIAASYNAGNELVTYIELIIDGKRFAGKYLQTPRSRGVCSFIWDSNGYSNGGHAIVVKLFSGDKLLGSVSGNLQVGNRPIDVIPPKISFYSVKSGEVFKGLREIKLSATDNSGKSPIVSVSVDKNLKLIKNNPPYSYAWDTTSYADGQHEIAAWGYDDAGNRGDAGTVNVVVKNNAKPAAAAASTAPVTKASSTVMVTETKAVVTKPEVTAKAAGAEPALPAFSGKSSAAPARATISKPSDAETRPAAVANAPAVSTPKQQTQLALSEPKVEGFASKSASQAKQTLPGSVRQSQSPTSGIKEHAALSDAESQTAVPTVSESVMASLPAALSDLSDPLTIPASRTAPEMKNLKPVMMAAISSTLDYESPALHANPLSPVMTPHEAHVKTAASSLKVLETGIESGVKMVAPGSVLMAMAPKPVLAAKVKFQAKSGTVKGSVKLVLGDNKISVTSADGKNPVPAAALRKVMEQLGAMVVWDQQAKTITAYNKGVRITLKVGEAKAKVNGTNVKMAAPVTIVEDRAVVDLKFFEKALKMELEYDPKTGAFALVKE